MEGGQGKKTIQGGTSRCAGTPVSNSSPFFPSPAVLLPQRLRQNMPAPQALVKYSCHTGKEILLQAGESEFTAVRREPSVLVCVGNACQTRAKSS